MPDENTDFHAELEILREAIDAYDRNIIKLLKERCEVVQQVGELKKGHALQGSYLRPRREATMMRHLLEQFKDFSFPEAGIFTIWRTLIGAATSIESPLNTIVLSVPGDESAFYLAREYFGSFVPSTQLHGAEQVIQQVSQDPHAIGIVPWKPVAGAGDWWKVLAKQPEPRPKVFGIIPFVTNDEDNLPPLFAIGQVELGATGDDTTLYVIEHNAPLPDELSLPILSQLEDKQSALIKIEGFHFSNKEIEEKIKKLLEKDGVENVIQITCIGTYANPYILGQGEEDE